LVVRWGTPKAVTWVLSWVGHWAETSAVWKGDSTVAWMALRLVEMLGNGLAASLAEKLGRVQAGCWVARTVETKVGTKVEMSADSMVVWTAS